MGHLPPRFPCSSAPADKHVSALKSSKNVHILIDNANNVTETSAHSCILSTKDKI